MGCQTKWHKWVYGLIEWAYWVNCPDKNNWSQKQLWDYLKHLLKTLGTLMGTIVGYFKVSYLRLSFYCDLNAVAYGLWTNVDVMRYPIGNVSNLGWKNVRFDSPFSGDVSNVGFGKSSHWEREQSWDLLVHLLEIGANMGFKKSTYWECKRLGFWWSCYWEHEQCSISSSKWEREQPSGRVSQCWIW